MQKPLLNPLGGVPDDRRGIAALEYALLAGLVGIVVLGVSFNFSTAESSLFGRIRQAVDQVAATLTSGAGSTSTTGTTGSTGGTGSTDDGSGHTGV